MKQINGMTLVEVMQKLKEPLPPEAFSTKFGYPSMKYKEVVKRLQAVVGPANYRFIIKKCAEVVVSGQPNVTTEGELNLLYDDGSVAFVAGGVGACRITLLNETGEPINLANDREGAVYDCFKRCCKVFGIGVEQLEQMRKGKGSTATEVTVDAELLNKFTKRGASGIGTRVRIDGEDVDFVIWKDKFPVIEACCGTVEEFMNRCTKRISCSGSYGTYKGAKQFVFTGFGEKS